MTNLATTLVNTTRSYPERIALRSDERELRYRDLDELSARVASWLLGRGITAGDRVGLMAPNTPEFAELFYGILRAGAVVVPMNPLFKAREVGYHLSDSGAALALAWHGVADQAATGAKNAGVELVVIEPDGLADTLARCDPAPAVADRAAADTAVILYTSGTTGQPKGAELTHDNMAQQRRGHRTTLLNLRPEDVVMAALPLFHSFGQTVSERGVAAGALPDPAAEVRRRRALEIMQRDQVTVLPGVPTMYGAICTARAAAPRIAASLRLCVVRRRGAAGRGAARVREALRLPGPRGLRALGDLAGRRPSTTRTGTASPARSAARSPASRCGCSTRRRAAAGGEIGEIAIRGDNVMKGYWRRPGRHRGGDRATAGSAPATSARWTTDGYFYIVDRKKDMIIRGGFNVYPREVEEVLYEPPGGRRGRGHRRARTTSSARRSPPWSTLKPARRSREPTSSGLRQGALAELQVPAPRVVRRRAAQGATGKILKRAIVVPPLPLPGLGAPLLIEHLGQVVA